MTSARPLWFLAISLMLVSCNSEPDDVSVSEVLLACDLITPGKLGGLGAPRDEYETCTTQCVADNTCAALEVLVCGQDPDHQALLDTCYMQCLQSHGHACNGQLIPPKYICDDYPDCMDGTDEIDCPPDFICADGSPLPSAYRCDEREDCNDGSDEADCPTATLFTCADGEQIPASFVCNFAPDCADESDEGEAQGCAQLSCANEGGP